MSNQPKKIVTCEVNGIVGHQIFRGRRISAMCGRIKVSSNHCSLCLGECEFQVEVEVDHEKTSN